MLFAERHGKLGRDGSRAHDRAEDLLTSTAFQLLRYLPMEVGLLAVLGRVRAVSAAGQVLTTAPPRLKLEGVTEAKYTFWPNWGPHGLPDVVVELLASGQSLGRFVIEVKLEAGKSGEAGDEDMDEEVSADQLHKYWQGLKEQFGNEGLGVVYLTSHIVPPAKELAGSIASERSDWLGWLSWRDVWAEMRKRDELAARDLADILAAKGLKGFDGFHAKLPTTLPSSGRFWASPQKGWFSVAPLSITNTPRFWSDNKGKK